MIGKLGDLQHFSRLKSKLQCKEEKGEKEKWKNGNGGNNISVLINHAMDFPLFYFPLSLSYTELHLAKQQQRFLLIFRTARKNGR